MQEKKCLEALSPKWRHLKGKPTNSTHYSVFTDLQDLQEVV